MNVETQPNIFLVFLNNTHVGPSPLSTLLAFIVAHDQTPQPTSILPTHLQLAPKTSYPTRGRQFTLRGLACHLHSY